MAELGELVSSKSFFVVADERNGLTLQRLGSVVAIAQCVVWMNIGLSFVTAERLIHATCMHITTGSYFTKCVLFT